MGGMVQKCAYSRVRALPLSACPAGFHYRTRVAMTTVQIDLPDQLAQQARNAGLLSPQKMEAMLRAQLRREAFEGLRALHERLSPEELTPETEQEIDQVVRQVRAEQRQRKAN